MAILFDQPKNIGLNKAPRIVWTFDTTGGCPTGGRTNPLMSMTFTVNSESIVLIQGEIIRRRDSNGICQTFLSGPGYPGINSDVFMGTQWLDSVIDFNDTRDAEWDNHCFRWMGYVPAGTQTFSLNAINGGNCLNLFGCGSGWGQMNAIIFE